MAEYIRLESKEELEWLQHAVANAVAKTRANPSLYCNIAPLVERIDSALSCLLDLEQVSKLLQEDLADIVEEPKKKRRSAEAIKADKSMALCKQHPSYKAGRRPSTDCKGCWAGYKKLEPNKYDAARRSFELQQKKKQLK